MGLFRGHQTTTNGFLRPLTRAIISFILGVIFVAFMVWLDSPGSLPSRYLLWCWAIGASVSGTLHAPSVPIAVLAALAPPSVAVYCCLSLWSRMPK